MIQPTNIVTNNISKELLRIGLETSTPVSELYIEINDIKTFVKDGDTDFVELFADDMEKFKEETSMRDYTIEFDQECDVDVLSKYEGYPFEKMITKIEFEDNNTRAYLVVQKGSKITYYDGLYNDFLNYITQQQVRSRIIVDLFSINYEDIIKQFVDVIKKVKNVTFKEDKRILVAEGIDEIESVSSNTVMTIEDNNAVGSEDEAGRIDYSNRGFLLSCAEGEQLFEFVKPQQGEHGRNCRGEVIEVEIVNLDVQPVFTTEDSIEVQDSFENIKYLAKRSGYLVKNGNEYDVSNSIDVGEISFKTTGTINTDLDTEISINVVKENPLEDAIESGMKVRVQKLSITGSIGSNTEIEARDIYISGQSHNESSIKCVNADIGLHKGKIVGRKIEVNTLDGGEIIADIAIVKNAINGKIRAKTIEIGTVSSYVTMEASEYIQVSKVKGEENKFIIDHLIDSGFDDNTDSEEAFLEELEKDLKELRRTLRDTTERLKKNLTPCGKIKSEIIKNKKQGIKISDILIKKFKSCKLMKIRYKKLKEDFEYKKSQYEQVQSKLLSSDADPFKAFILIKEPINGYNTIVYKLTDPQIDISLKTNESMNDKIFKLIEDEDGILKIINSKEL